MSRLLRDGLKAYRDKHLEYKDGRTITFEKSGKTYTPRSYLYTGLTQTKLFDRIYEIAKNNGFTKAEAEHLMKRDLLGSGLICVYHSVHKGTRALELWEYEMLKKYFRLDEKWKCDYEGDKRYSHAFESGKLVLESKWMPKFYMVLNIEKWLDFEVDFSKDAGFREIANKSASDNVRIKRALKECKNILQWYFIKQAGRKVLPFKWNEFELLFKKKWYNNEIRMRIEKKNKIM